MTTPQEPQAEPTTTLESSSWRPDFKKEMSKGDLSKGNVTAATKPVIYGHSGSFGDGSSGGENYSGEETSSGGDEGGNARRHHLTDSDPPPVEMVENLYGFWQAVAFNCMNMFGTGPFVSFPYAIASVNPPGPQAIIGYGVAVIACISDSFVWAELGAMWPHSGGSYVYLKELYGEDTWGRFMSFMFIWQFFISGPAELASSFIAMSDYLSYVTGATTEYWIKTPVAIAFLLFCFFLLYRKINDVGKLALGLWGITIFAVIFTFIAGFSNFDAENLKAPPGAFSDRSMIMLGLAAATRFGVYDMTGYYDVCQMGGEVRNPRKTIPYSCISTAVCVGTTFILTYLAIGGVMSYYGPDGFGERLENGESVFIMSDFAEKLLGRNFAIFFTIIVVVTIFGSAFSMLCGFQYIPQCAAEDGYFFKIFAHRSEKHGGLADVSLITITGISVIFCFFSFDLVVDAMTTMLILVQFIGQSVGLIYYRWVTPIEEIPDHFKMPLYPLPCIIQLVLFFCIFITTDNYLVSGNNPILELSLLFLLFGVALFLVWSKVQKQWPFKQPVGEEVTEETKGDAEVIAEANEEEEEGNKNEESIEPTI